MAPMKRLSDGFGIAPDHDEVASGGGVGIFAPLFPIPQGAERNPKPLREFFLAGAKRAANDLHLWRPLNKMGNPPALPGRQ